MFNVDEPGEHYAKWKARHKGHIYEIPKYAIQR